MFLVILYIAAGIYFLLMSLNLLHKEYMSRMNRHRRLGLIVMGLGFVILGISQVFYYTMRSDDAPAKAEKIRDQYRHYQAPE